MRRLSAAAGSALLLAAIPANAGEPSPEPRSFTIAASGDILIMETIWQMADTHIAGYRTFDSYPMFAPVEPWIAEADLAICHLEGSLSPDNSRISDEPRFSSPHEPADAIATAGYDTCSTASNHSLDQGFEGLKATLDVLDAAGIRHTGTARTAEEDRSALYEVNGVAIGHSSFTLGTNYIRTSERFAVNYLDSDQILADAAWARDQGAEFIIVSLHWGTEYQSYPSWPQQQLAADLLECPDVDVILGHHAHVVQAIDRINEKVGIYGMGNHLSDIRGWPEVEKSGGDDGVIIRLEVTEQQNSTFRVGDVSYTATWVHPQTKEILPVTHTLAYGDGRVDNALEKSLSRTVQRISRFGFEADLTPLPWHPLACRGRQATIWGTTGDDLLIGTPGDDVISARGGDDSIWAGGGDDLVCGDEGNDFISGGDGGDRLEGEDGNDLLMGYDGFDVLWGGDGDDILSGLDDDDLLVEGSGNDSLIGGDGDDVLWGGHGDDQISGGNGIDVCRAATSTLCES